MLWIAVPFDKPIKIGPEEITVLCRQGCRHFCQKNEILRAPRLDSAYIC